jgi:hypothetical protein
MGLSCNLWPKKSRGYPKQAAFAKVSTRMKTRKKIVLYLFRFFVLLGLGCGVKGPPTPYVDVETQKNLEPNSQLNATEKPATKTNHGKGSNIQ